MTVKKLAAFLVAVSATALMNAGCESHTTTNSEGTKSITLTKPSNVTLNQGESHSVDIKISRKGFNEPVDVRFEGLPEGVSVEERDHRIAKDSTSTTFNLKASAKAPPVTDKAVTAIATGGGAEVKETFNVSVKAK